MELVLWFILFFHFVYTDKIIAVNCFPQLSTHLGAEYRGFRDEYLPYPAITVYKLYGMPDIPSR